MIEKIAYQSPRFAKTFVTLEQGLCYASEGKEITEKGKAEIEAISQDAASIDADGITENWE